MPSDKKEAPGRDRGDHITYLIRRVKNTAGFTPRQDVLESAVASTLALQSYHELRALEILPDEAMLLERIRRHSDTFRLLVQTARAFLVEVRG